MKEFLKTVGRIMAVNLALIGVLRVSKDILKKMDEPQKETRLDHKNRVILGTDDYQVT